MPLQRQKKFSRHLNLCRVGSDFERNDYGQDKTIQNSLTKTSSAREYILLMAKVRFKNKLIDMTQD